MGGDGSTVTDDSNATTGLANGGFRTRLLPMFTQIIAIANFVLGRANAAATSATNAATSETNAATSAATALNAPGTSATSVTSLTIGTGNQSLTVQANKLFVVGMTVSIASTASPTNAMYGIVTSYNSGTGALGINVSSVSGNGTFAAWSVALSGAVGAAGPILPYIHVREQQVSGQSAGGSVAGTQTRVLNTVVANTISGASLASNQITLPAGSYRVQASAPCLPPSTASTEFHQASIYNVTGATTLAIGTSEAPSTAGVAGSPPQTRSFITGSFTLAVASTIQVNHYISTANASAGLGRAAGAGVGEVFTVVEITKVA
ncbi:hypothetical protein H3V53_38290 [Paraburkholderia bengalensis]|uniref:Uncharacterized protein n=1 Tax=Paraburkholderia bengalensis TaxID=2747562 RepID=A0ABU8J5B3_9BURK